MAGNFQVCFAVFAYRILWDKIRLSRKEIMEPDGDQLRSSARQATEASRLVQVRRMRVCGNQFSFTHVSTSMESVPLVSSSGRKRQLDDAIDSSSDEDMCNKSVDESRQGSVDTYDVKNELGDVSACQVEPSDPATDPLPSECADSGIRRSSRQRRQASQFDPTENDFSIPNWAESKPVRRRYVPSAGCLRWLEFQAQRNQCNKDADVCVIDGDDELSFDVLESFRHCMCAHCFLESKHSLLASADLSHAISFDELHKLDELERSRLLSMLPPDDISSDDRLRALFSFLHQDTSESIVDHYQQLLAAGNLDSTSRDRQDLMRADKLQGARLEVWQQASEYMWPLMPSVVPKEWLPQAMEQARQRLRVTQARPRNRLTLTERAELDRFRQRMQSRLSAHSPPKEVVSSRNDVIELD
jgi:hypothetical protein